MQKIAYCKTDSDLIAKQKGTYKERGTKRKEEEKKKKKGKDAKGAPSVPSAAATAGECPVHEMLLHIVAVFDFLMNILIIMGKPP